MLSAKPWRVEIVLWFCAAQAIVLCAGLTVIGVLQKAGFTAFQPPSGSGAVLIGTLTFQGATWMLIPLFLRWHQMHWRDAFGLRRMEFSRTWFPVVPVVIVLLPAMAWLLQYLSICVLTKIGWPPGNETAVTVLTSAHSWWLRIYLCAFTVVIGPVAEEFIFRGLLYPFLKQRGRPLLAWLGVSFLFALVHWDGATFVALFVLALALTWLYERTDSLLAPIMAHAFFNAVNLVLLYYSQYEFKLDGP
jgi:membrane protease YdiL (CAAX protease family)